MFSGKICVFCKILVFAPICLLNVDVQQILIEIFWVFVCSDVKNDYLPFVPNLLILVPNVCATVQREHFGGFLDPGAFVR